MALAFFRAFALRCLALRFASPLSGRFTQSLSRRPPRQTARRSGVRRRSTSGGAAGMSETSTMMCLIPVRIGRCPEGIRVIRPAAIAIQALRLAHMPGNPVFMPRILRSAINRTLGLICRNHASDFPRADRPRHGSRLQRKRSSSGRSDVGHLKHHAAVGSRAGTRAGTRATSGTGARSHAAASADTTAGAAANSAACAAASAIWSEILSRAHGV